MNDNDLGRAEHVFFLGRGRITHPSCRFAAISLAIFWILPANLNFVRLVQASLAGEVYAGDGKGQLSNSLDFPPYSLIQLGVLSDSQHPMQNLLKSQSLLGTLPNRMFDSPAFWMASTLGQPPATTASLKITPAADTWLEGKAFTRKLSDIQTSQWRQLTLKQVVQNIGSAHQIKVWLDRRVDSARLIDLTVKNLTVADALEQLAAQADAVAVIHSPVIFFVPKQHAADLPVVLADARRQAARLPTELANIFTVEQAVRWPKLVQPNQLFRDWCSPLADKITAIQSLPYDVWDQGSLPALSLIDRLAILAFGFGKRLDLQPPPTQRPPDEIQIQLEDLTKEMLCQCLIDDINWHSALQKMKDDLSQEFPTLSYKSGITQKRILSGQLKDLGIVFDRLQQDSPSPDTPATGSKLYSLKVSQQPAINILDAIAGQTQRKIIVQGDIEQLLQKMIDLEVKDATLESMIDTIATQCQLKIIIGRTTLTISPKP